MGYINIWFFILYVVKFSYQHSKNSRFVNNFYLTFKTKVKKNYEEYYISFVYQFVTNSYDRYNCLSSFALCENCTSLVTESSYKRLKRLYVYINHFLMNQYDIVLTSFGEKIFRKRRKSFVKGISILVCFLTHTLFPATSLAMTELPPLRKLSTWLMKP